MSGRARFSVGPSEAAASVTTPIFKLHGLSVSAAELRPDEKNAISHRALAFGQLMPFVRAALLFRRTPEGAKHTNLGARQSGALSIAIGIVAASFFDR